MIPASNVWQAVEVLHETQADLAASKEALSASRRYARDERELAQAEALVEARRRQLSDAWKQLWAALPVGLRRLQAEAAAAAWDVSDAEQRVQWTRWRYAAGEEDDEQVVDDAYAARSAAYQRQHRAREALRPWQDVLDVLTVPDPWWMEDAQ